MTALVANAVTFQHTASPAVMAVRLRGRYLRLLETVGDAGMNDACVAYWRRQLQRERMSCDRWLQKKESFLHTRSSR